MYYKYQSPIGTFTIRKGSSSPLWVLRLNGKKISECSYPQVCAGSVSGHLTGLRRWDRTRYKNVPESLDGWTKID